MDGNGTAFDVVAAARRHFTAVRPDLERLYAELWARPELPMMEVESARILTGWLEGRGFAVERGAGGLPTAFVATKGGDGPLIGLLAEYDALPGLANAARPERSPLPLAAGHACGHNHIGPNAAAAAVAAALASEECGVAGTVAVYGCPAEEILWGKVAMMEEGVFDGADALLANHADYQNGALSRPCQAVVIGELIFRGAARHAGTARQANALEALELTVQTFERRRGTGFPDCVVVHVVRSGGVTPGVVPEETRLGLAVKHDASFERALEVYRGIVAVGRFCAADCGVAVAEQYVAGARGYLANDAVAGVLRGNLERVGPPRWSAEAVGWIEDLCAASDPDADPRLPRDLGYFDAGCDPYGQDDGELSWRVPLGRVNWALPAAVPLHNWAMTALCGYPGYNPGPLMAAEALAMTAAELAARPDRLAAARAELERRTGGRRPETPPVGLRRVLTETPAAYWAGTYAPEAP